METSSTTLDNCSSLLVGALLASLWVRRRTPTKGLVPAAWIASGVLVACIAFGHADESFIFLGGFTLFAVAAAVVILATLESNWPGNRFLGWTPLRAVGRVSYGLYLWHLPVIVVVAKYGGDWSTGERVVVALSATTVCTMLSWILVETPALRLKSRLQRRRGA